MKKREGEEGTQSWAAHLSLPVVQVSALGSLQATGDSELFLLGSKPPKLGFLILVIYGRSATALQPVLIQCTELLVP